MMKRSGVLFVVSGPSGAGKSTLCKNMVAQVPQTALSVSCTTRNPRPGEQHGVDYCFIDEPQFRGMIDRNEFVEWAEVYGKLYGTPKRQLEESMSEGIDVLLDIDAQGARQIMKQFSGAVYVFVTPPSLEVLRTRLYRRASDSTEEIQRRLELAREEIANFRSYHYLIRNEDLIQATKDLESIICAERVKTARLDTEWLKDKGLIEDKALKENSTIV
ncbi:guanylate kinase [Candidatus Nitronereus thalassa]|uniref:Guanylate kinase n=2 Tax=Candidatus Nitronereus thalassa TaxID=3020898 RepID=A0ABU3K6I1_9BACT|nr:guanylate kinase [Candidatus Nitronereus thalassa]MDT7042044.1 guanylate kinase [Candidatus Nitronereus thalassa]